MEKKSTLEKDKIEELKNKWKRALADYQNLEKRVAEEKEGIIKFSNFSLIYDLLPVLDSFEDASLHFKDEGLALCIKKFKDTLSAFGVSEVECIGKYFNADFMEAVGMEAGEENKVLKTVKKGYTLNGKVLRPAKVMVGRKE